MDYSRRLHRLRTDWIITHCYFYSLIAPSNGPNYVSNQWERYELCENKTENILFRSVNNWPVTESPVSVCTAPAALCKKEKEECHSTHATQSKRKIITDALTLNQRPWWSRTRNILVADRSCMIMSRGAAHQQSSAGRKKSHARERAVCLLNDRSSMRWANARGWWHFYCYRRCAMVEWRHCTHFQCILRTSLQPTTAG